MATTGERAVIVSAPPGGGKSSLIRAIARSLARPAGAVVPILSQTNDQADDLVVHLHRERPRLSIGRLHAPRRLSPAVAALAAVPGSRLHVSTDVDELLAAKTKVIVAPAAKWAHSTLSRQVEWAIVDEAYQMRADALYGIADLADRLLLVGDPGQLSPFTTLNTTRWVGLPHSPVRPAMCTLAATRPRLPVHSMAVSHRLPPSAATIISDALYPDTPFIAGTKPADRTLTLRQPPRRLGHQGLNLDAVLDLAAASGWAYAELPARHTRPDDPGLARLLGALVHRLLQRRPAVTSELPHEQQPRALRTADIAVIVSHNSQADRVRTALAAAGVPAGVTVATANRIQGRECAVSFFWHPLSGRRDTSPFHIDPGRLAVGLTRHRHAVIVASRAGLDDCLLESADTDDLYLGEPEQRLDPIEVNWRILNHLMNHQAG
ncbi:AAA family ATPase [Actinoplanes sp. NPDC049598]